MSEAEHVSYCPPLSFPTLWFMPVWSYTSSFKLLLRWLLWFTPVTCL